MMEEKNCKVAILAVADLRHMTAAGYYYYELEKMGVPFDIICTSRYAEDSKMSIKGKIYSFKWISSTYQSKIEKIIPFLKFRKFAINLIRKNQYKYIIVWGENTGILFGFFLKRKYAGNYCLNIRDIDIFDLGCVGRVLKGIESSVIKHSNFYTAPSESGLIFNHRYAFVLLNRDFNILKQCRIRNVKKTEEPLVITYMGLIHQYKEYFFRVIDAFANDKRFVLRFYGEGAEWIQKYAKEKQILNIEVGGAFPPERTREYLDQTDFIFSSYGYINPGVGGGIGVKISYGPQLRIPIISDNYGTWFNIQQKYKMGYGLDSSNLSQEPDKLYEWYCKMDFEEFKTGCMAYCNYVDRNNQKVVDALKNILM